MKELRGGYDARTESGSSTNNPYTSLKKSWGVQSVMNLNLPRTSSTTSLMKRASFDAKIAQSQDKLHKKKADEAIRL